MSTPHAKRRPRFALRMILMLLAALLVFGGVFAVKAIMGAQTDRFFDNMPQPASAVSAAEALTGRWTDDAEAVGTFVAVNGTDVTTEAGGVVRAIEFEAGHPARTDWSRWTRCSSASPPPPARRRRWTHSAR